MESLRVKPLATLLLLFLCLTTSFARDGILLRYNWQQGQEIILDKTLELAGTLRVATGEAVPVTQRAMVRKRVLVKEVSPEGQARLQIATLSISATKETAGESFQYSLRPDRMVINDTIIWEKPEGKQGVSRVEKRLRAMFKPSVKWISPQGHSASPAMPDYLRDDLTRVDTFALFGLGAEGWIPLPEEAVSEGQSWREGSAEPVVDATRTLVNLSSMTMESLDSTNNQAVISFKRQWKTRGLEKKLASGKKNSTLGRWVRFDRNSQEFEGKVYFDTTAGRVLRCTASGRALLRYAPDRVVLVPGNNSPMIEYDWQQVTMETLWSWRKSQ
jgi:hypothetical protein